jgi:hypothetical protein
MAHMALKAHFPPANLPAIPPNQTQIRPRKRAARETSFAPQPWKPVTHGGKMLKLIN